MAVTTTDRVVETVRDLILHGDLAPGARLGEVELAVRLGVSRTPVREALTRLAAHGLVDMTPHRGARVTTWSIAELEGVFDLRSSLEPRLTALAVPRAKPEDLDLLDDLAQRMLEVGMPGRHQDLEALVPLNRAFHDRIVAIADHPALAGALASAIQTPIQRRNFHKYDERSLRRSLSQHVEIVDAFHAVDATWAEAVMTAHIRNARAVMVRAARSAARTEEDEMTRTRHTRTHDTSTDDTSTDDTSTHDTRTHDTHPAQVVTS